MSELIRRLLGRERSKLPPFDFSRNRFRAKKIWPPQFHELTERQQFRFERKYKRRLRLASIKPTWNKWTKIVQWSMISFIAVYALFWYDFANDRRNPRPGEQPFKKLRAWMNGLTSGFWSHTSTETQVEPEPEPEPEPEHRPSFWTWDPIVYQRRLRDDEEARDRAERAQSQRR